MSLKTYAVSAAAALNIAFTPMAKNIECRETAKKIAQSEVVREAIYVNKLNQVLYSYDDLFLNNSLFQKISTSLKRACADANFLTDAQKTAKKEINNKILTDAKCTNIVNRLKTTLKLLDKPAIDTQFLSDTIKTTQKAVQNITGNA